MYCEVTAIGSQLCRAIIGNLPHILALILASDLPPCSWCLLASPCAVNVPQAAQGVHQGSIPVHGHPDHPRGSPRAHSVHMDLLHNLKTSPLMSFFFLVHQMSHKSGRIFSQEKGWPHPPGSVDQGKDGMNGKASQICTGCDIMDFTQYFTDTRKYRCPHMTFCVTSQV